MVSCLQACVWRSMLHVYVQPQAAFTIQACEGECSFFTRRITELAAGRHTEPMFLACAVQSKSHRKRLSIWVLKGNLFGQHDRTSSSYAMSYNHHTTTIIVLQQIVRHLRASRNFTPCCMAVSHWFPNLCAMVPSRMFSSTRTSDFHLRL